jgi:hypothetical protein
MELTFLEEERKLRHPYYKIMEVKGAELKNTLLQWSRTELIDWLSWNDRNGVYKDEQSLQEFGEIITKELALEIMMKQITEGQGS